MTTHTIVYHSADLDGFCSGAIAKYHLLKCGIPENNINLIGWNYGQEVPQIPDDMRIIMTDISFPWEDMIDLQKRCFLTWIDHHKSAILDSIKYGYQQVLGLRRSGDSASLLAWISLFGPNIPEVVYWVDRYDVWKKEDKYCTERTWSQVMATQYGLRYYMTDPSKETTHDNYSWQEVLESNDFMNDIRDTGAIIYDAEIKSNKIRCSKAFDLIFEGHKFAALNNGLAGSAVLDSYARSDHDGLMVFSYHGKRGKWDVSMYQNEKSAKEVDLSLIAVKYGGGGHFSACGFQIENIEDVLAWKEIEKTRIESEKQAAAFMKENEAYDLKKETES